MTAQNSPNAFRQSSIQIVINYTLELLKRLKEFTEISLPSNASEKMKKQIEEINAYAVDAIKDLETPTLRLAFVGATSSGKSTLVNALTGHRIMPMESGEMSAGIVRIHHDSSKTDKMRLRIDVPDSDRATIKGEGCPWNPVDKDDCTLDNDIYYSLSNCMKSYHEKRKTMEYLRAPNAEVWCNTLLGSNKELLQLPEGVQLEIVDLPGIKEVNDASSLFTVKQTIGKNVLTLVMNYDDTAEDRLNGLLDEIKESIEAFHGDTSMLLFVLNKIDHRMPSCDDPLDRKIDYLSERIRAALNLKEKPMIFPVKAQTFMLPQISLGQININNISKEDSLIYLSESVAKFSLDSLEDDWYSESLLVSCNTLYKKVQDVLIMDSNATINLQDGDVLEKKVKKIYSVLQEEGRIESILESAFVESGLASYIDALNSRIDEHFSRLVIQPAVSKLIAITSEFIKQMKGECDINIKNNIDELKQLLDNIESTQKRVDKRLTEIKNKIEKEKDIVVKSLSSTKVSEQQMSLNYLKGTIKIDEDKCKYLNPVHDIFNIIDHTIQANAVSQVQEPIKDFLDNKMSIDALKSVLKENGVSAYTCKKFTLLLLSLKSVFDRYKDDKGAVYIEWKDTPNNKKEIDQIEDNYKNSIAMLPVVIGEYFQFALQIQSQKFEETLAKSVRTIRQDIVKSLDNKIADKNIALSIVPDFAYISHNVDMTFDVTSLPAPTSNLKSGIDTHTITTYRDRTWAEWFGNWFGGNTPRYVAVHRRERYLTLDLGTSKDFTKEMSKIIKSAKVSIMQSIGEWFRLSSDNVIELITGKTREVSVRYKNICEQRQKEVKKEIGKKQETWEKYQSHLEEIVTDDQEQQTVLGGISAVIEQGFDAVPWLKKDRCTSTKASATPKN